MDLDKACLLCDVLGGQLPMPKSMEDNTKMFINRFTNGEPQHFFQVSIKKRSGMA